MSFHGGPLGFDTVLWRILLDDEEPELFSLSEIQSIQSLPRGSYAIFCSISPHGNQGYPGDLLTEVLISLVPSFTGHAGYIVIVYRSKLIGIEKVVTPVNLSQSLSFNMDASLANSQWPEVASVTGHRLAIGVSPWFSVCPSDLKKIWLGFFFFAGRLRRTAAWIWNHSDGISTRFDLTLPWFSTTASNQKPPLVSIQ